MSRTFSPKAEKEKKIWKKAQILKMLEWQPKYDSLEYFRSKNSIFCFLGFLGDSCSLLAVQCYWDLYMGEGGVFS